MPDTERGRRERALDFSRPLEFVRTVVEANVATVTFCRPPVNAVDMRAMSEIRTVFGEIGTHTDARVVIFTSAGAKSFCAGADLKAFAGQQDVDLASRIDEGLIARETFSAIRACPVPVIAAVNGPAIGAGMALAASCDIIMADHTARFGATEINVGLLGAVSYLRRLVGEYRARELFFTGELVSADELLGRGSVTRLVEPEQLIDACKELARKIASKSPIGLRLAKDSINRTEHLDLEQAYRVEQDYTARLRRFNDSREAVTAFLEKRQPRWTLT